MSYEFKPTGEQDLIINSIKEGIEEYLESFEEKPRGKRVITKASAGTGKSSTIIFSMRSIVDLFKGYADESGESYDNALDGPKMLYLVLNAEMRKSMTKTIEKIPQLANVRVSTFHKFMLDHLKVTFPEIADKIDFKRNALKKSDAKDFIDALFKGAFGFKNRENRIPHTLVLNAMERYMTLFLNSAAINSNDMNNLILNDSKFSKIYSNTDDVIETNEFLKPFAKALYVGVYEKNKDLYNEILNVNSIDKDDLSNIDMFIKMLGHFFINKVLDPQSNIPITHDVYFKIAYINIINTPELDLFKEYSSIYVDEGQDLDPMTLNILETATPVVSYFGDSDQQLYAFKGSVDSLKIVEEKNQGNVDVLSLTESFRYRHDVAVLASILLRELKDKDVNIKGKRTKVSNTLDAQVISDKHELYDRVEKYAKELSNVYTNPKVRRRQKIAVISRTNENVLKNTLEFLRYKETNKSNLVCSIEGSFKKKIKDAINGKFPDEILSKLSRAVNNFNDIQLEDYRSIAKIKDILDETEFKFLVDESMSVEDLKLLVNSRMGEATSDILFLSAHQSKGKEYTYIVLDSDYFMLKKVGESVYDIKQRMSLNTRDKALFDDEVNIAYVAVTRAKHSLMFYKNDNLLYSFFKGVSEEIEENLSPFSRTEFFSNGYHVKYAKDIDSSNKVVYTKEVSDPFENVEWYEISYVKPTEDDIIAIDDINSILRSTSTEDGIETHEYKFLDEKIFKKDKELTKNEREIISSAIFTKSTEIEYKPTEKKILKNEKDENLFSMNM